MKKRILVVSFSPLHSDPRVRRQLYTLLDEGYELTAAGYTDPGIDGVEWVCIDTSPKSLLKQLFSAIKLKLRLFRSYYYSLTPVVSFLCQWKDLERPGFDLIIANDIESLPVALDIAGDTPILLDAHEYSPQEMNSWRFRFFFAKFKDWQCRTYLPKAAAMSTVCQGISELYNDQYGIKSFLTLNAPKYTQLSPVPLQNKRIRMVHHGGAAPSRGLETMISMLEFLDDRFELHFYLVVNGINQMKYLDELKALASDMKANVVFHEPVATDVISEEINQYDVGVYPLKPESINDAMALPNKFFEFVQARLAIVIGPSSEMVRLLHKHDLGVVSKDFTVKSMANVILNISDEEIWQYKQNADMAARELSYDEQAPLLLKNVDQLLHGVK